MTVKPRAIPTGWESGVSMLSNCYRAFLDILKFADDRLCLAGRSVQVLRRGMSVGAICLLIWSNPPAKSVDYLKGILSQA